MKGIFFNIIFIFLFSSIQAQEESHLKYGLGAGFNVSDMTYKAAPHFYNGIYPDAKFGFNGYVFLGIPVYKVYSVQTEIGYYGLGSKIVNIQNGSNPQNETTDLNYLTISVLPKITFKGTTLSFFLGPSLGIKLNSKAVLSESTDPGGPSGGDYANNDYKSVDVFGFVGAEYFLPNGFGVSVRYMQGLADIAGPSYGDGKIFNRAFTFSIAYQLKAR
jgi:outer membrane protein with beta-barrel domain